MDQATRLKASNFKRLPVVSVRRQNSGCTSALVYAASRVVPCVFVKCVVIGVVVTSVLEYHAFEPIQHRVMSNCFTFEGKQLQTCLPVVSVRRQKRRREFLQHARERRLSRLLAHQPSPPGPSRPPLERVLHPGLLALLRQHRLEVLQHRQHAGFGELCVDTEVLVRVPAE